MAPLGRFIAALAVSGLELNFNASRGPRLAPVASGIPGWPSDKINGFRAHWGPGGHLRRWIRRRRRLRLRRAVATLGSKQPTEAATCRPAAAKTSRETAAGNGQLGPEIATRGRPAVVGAGRTGKWEIKATSDLSAGDWVACRGRPSRDRRRSHRFRRPVQFNNLILAAWGHLGGTDKWLASLRLGRFGAPLANSITMTNRPGPGSRPPSFR